ncbi:TPA: methionyl-tRNA formyltransferase, partial [Acinetobacter baumannii]
AAPIQRAIATGDDETGITIMQMAAGLDTGDMMYKTYCPITSEDTSATLHDKLAAQGATAICAVLESEETLQKYLAEPEVQDESLTVYAHKLVKSEARIDWAIDAIQVDRNIRAFNPWPVAFIQLDENNALRVWNSKISSQSKVNAQAGEIIAIDKQGVHVACGENTFICLTSVQWPGGKALNAQQIAQTQKLHVGQILP